MRTTDFSSVETDCKSLMGEFMNDDFSFTITDYLGVISKSKSGWQLELNKVSWGGRPAKFDLRSWAPEHQKMGKGITLTEEELKSLAKLIDSLQLDNS